VLLSHCTISSNYGNGGTGGLVVGPGTVTLSNPIVANNSDLAGPGNNDIGGSGATVILTGNNLIAYASTYASAMPPGLPNASGQYVGTTANPLNPLLAPLAYDGGPTPTMPPLPGSLAIDNAISSGFTVDQRGYPRPVDGNGDGVAVARQVD
jgi:hypothetical protein